ncbi:helix-turn-helix domain-containing protein [Mycolicibacterium doricum]|uniref:helix-turn-helix domain-containing protein n=1 Tax=Mycolicibacterium doricum TaxID=126673 RepID=UPI001F2E393A|nr:helix-turn-helix domain-containing protein [Mycolicibacterium doricum]
MSGVLLDAEEADYVARALDLLARLLAGQRSHPAARLAAVTAKLRKSTDKTGDSTQSVSESAREFAAQRDSMHDPAYATMGTGDAARILGITPNGARDLARRRRIPARRTGTRWLFDAAAVIVEAERRASKQG